MADRSIQTRHSRIFRLPGIRVIGTGSYVPENVVANEDLTSLGCDAEWIVQRTGIRERRHASPGTKTSDMATIAAERCLQQSGRQADEVDLVVLGTFTADLPMPATACQIQDRLGINAPAFDVHAACAGFIYSMITGMQFVANGTSKLALLVGADTNSRVANPEDKKTYPLFGDGAGAVLVEAGNSDQGLLAYTLGADGSGHDLLCIPMGGSADPVHAPGVTQGQQFMRMDGRPVFKWAVRLIESTVRDVTREAGLDVNDIDLFIFHQANSRIIDAAAVNLGADPDKVLVNVDRYGNTSAGSIPLALDEAFRAGKIQPGSRIILSGFGGGLAWGTALLSW
ncbi:MAG: 3-oxoacyl-ACP synthase [Planctomycetaceae bacterium]|nr:3-oxoacyl-ACP synthase [Planctomycetaceae bacterium]|tara:strand:+ start:2632 stop:3651 length:1020 start_codon:yes stop_codon:yes gene_type:complete